MGEVKFNKTEKKDGLLGIAHRNWNNILAEINGMMGTNEVFEMETPPPVPEGTGILFVVKNRVLYPTWTDKLKGFGIIEFKSSSSVITQEPYDAFMNRSRLIDCSHVLPVVHCLQPGC